MVVGVITTIAVELATNDCEYVFIHGLTRLTCVEHDSCTGLFSPLCVFFICFFFFNDTATPEIYTYCHTLSLHDALPIFERGLRAGRAVGRADDRRCDLRQPQRRRQLPAEIETGERGQFGVVAAVDESGLAERRPALQAERHLLGVDHLVAEPARQVPARIIAEDPVMFPPAEAKGEGALVDPVLRFQLGQIAFDRRLAVGALIIGLRAQLVRPVDPLARDRESGADTRRTGVAAALRRAALPLAFPVIPDFRSEEQTS